MKILLISDTHSYMDQWILDHVTQADEVWHAGDIGSLEVTEAIESLKPLRAVYGNIDNAEIRTLYPLHHQFTVDGLRVWITHIGGYPGRYNPRLRAVLYNDPPDLFICGHSHILKVMNDKRINCLHMNPGAVGRHGFHKKRTMLKFEINAGKVENLTVIEKDRSAE